jgi:methylenetetrahydrofolate reductase (NADPH)
MLRDYSVELVPAAPRLIENAIERLQPRTLVSLTWIPGSNPMDMVAPAAKLRRAGLFVMPHVGARHLQSGKQLQELAARLVGEAGIDRVLIVAGDRRKPAGPFDSSLAIMQSGVFQRVGILNMSVAGFPEGNPHISPEVLDAALAAKVAFAQQEGIRLSLTTQFCFSAGPILSWLGRLRERGIDVPVRVGLAGPAGVMTLLRYAVRCGVGNSAHVLTQNPAFAKALMDSGPEPIMREMATTADRDEWNRLAIAGFHFYLFGGLNRTLDWIAASKSRKPVAVYT